MKNFIGIFDWIGWCHGWQVPWTLEWFHHLHWWLGLEDGCWKLCILWRASLSDAKTLDREFQDLPFSCWVIKNSSNSDKRLGMPGGDKQSHWPSSPRAKCSTVLLNWGLLLKTAYLGNNTYLLPWKPCTLLLSGSTAKDMVLSVCLHVRLL